MSNENLSNNLTTIAALPQAGGVMSWLDPEMGRPAGENFCDDEMLEVLDLRPGVSAIYKLRRSNLHHLQDAAQSVGADVHWDHLQKLYYVE